MVVRVIELVVIGLIVLVGIWWLMKLSKDEPERQRRERLQKALDNMALSEELAAAAREAIKNGDISAEQDIQLFIKAFDESVSSTHLKQVIKRRRRNLGQDV